MNHDNATSIESDEDDLDSLPVAAFDDEASLEAAHCVPTAPTVKPSIPYHGFYILLSSVILLLAFTMRSDGPSKVFLPGVSAALPELCMTKATFGIPCPGCGMTRGFISIAHGQWARAWMFNPASFLVFCFIAGQIPWRIWQIVRIRSGKPELSDKVFIVPIFVMTAVLFAQWGIRFFV